MLNSALIAAAQEAEQHRELPMPAWAFGLIALGAFFALFLFTWSFRSVGNRH